ncbi:uncharacterized protein LOC128093262 [Culex pipiens pallens]|uniref:uncharacterized protein LOC128093262 n=1 Tax=Culex pipiens pallens TaxID=42434 RepID=UPI0022AA98CD|nr:uncharacterized protein LOC128093262 [Culex pipiens pallens]
MTRRPRSIQVLLGLLIATGVASQAPASEFTFGTYLPTLTPCYSTSVNKRIVTLGPISEIVGFTPPSAVRYIRVWTDNLLPFYATFLSVFPVRIQLASIFGGKLNANVQIYCT